MRVQTGNWRFGLLGMISIAALGGVPAFAESEAWKLSVSGDRIIYDTETQEDSEIENEDIEAFRDLLRANPGVTTLVLNSDGGSVWAGEEIARIALDYELHTVVDGVCSSSCVDIFLAGDIREMTRGSKIGFHLRNWSPSAVENYYNNWAESEGWDTPFELGSWIYADTQAEIYDSLSYIVSRGVEPGFAIRSKTPRENVWFPLRQELLEAGVLTK